MGNDRQENPVLFHLNSEIYKNGIKFDRDRTFRNKLVVITVLLMAVLLIIATVSCIGMAKFRTERMIYNDTYCIKKNYTASLGSVEYGEVLREIQTSFVPPVIAYEIASHEQSPVKNDKPGRKRRNTDFSSEIHTENGDIFSNHQKHNCQKLTEKNAEVLSLEKNEGRRNEEILNKEMNEKTPIKADRLENIKEVSKFWKGENDPESIRMSQAKRMMSYMDLTADPCDDFYQYACGNWNKSNPIPQDKAGYDIFELLRESLDMVLRELLTEPSDNHTSQAARKAKEFYESCMDEDTLEKRGNEPLLSLIKRLKGWPIIDKDWNSSNFTWVDLTASLKVYNNDVLITQWIGPDIKNSTDYVIQFDQTDLGLPSRDYFLKESNAAYLEAYMKYLIKIAVLLGADKAKATVDAEEIIEFEKELAEITLAQQERRNMSELYMKLTLSELSELIPEIDWMKYLTVVLARNVNHNETVVTYALKYFKALVPLLNKTDDRIVCNYLMWRFMRHAVNSLDRKFQDAKQEFFYALSGREKMPLRWSYCVAQVNVNLGMALGSIFVQRYFDESSKNDTVHMTQELMQSFRDMLNSAEWIDNDTKILALNKINAMTLGIGYPDFLLDQMELDRRYSTVNITKSLYFENTLNILQHAVKQQREKLGKVVNRTQWNMPPTVVNAYYSRNINQIMVPAGFLQPPFYHKYFPKSLNYGGIGVAIGHEITHGFDDKGRLFDQNGNFHKWWKEETILNFHRRAQCIIDQYSAYTITEIDMRIDGVSTQGENIADNGGIRQAFRAYERWLSQSENPDERLPGINATNYQLFFLNFAQIWCGGMRPEASKNKLKTAQHSPGRFRVIGTLSNSEEFARVFNCPNNRTMNPSNKCSLW